MLCSLWAAAFTGARTAEIQGVNGDREQPHGSQVCDLPGALGKSPSMVTRPLAYGKDWKMPYPLFSSLCLQTVSSAGKLEPWFCRAKSILPI